MQHDRDRLKFENYHDHPEKSLEHDQSERADRGITNDSCLAGPKCLNRNRGQEEDDDPCDQAM